MPGAAPGFAGGIFRAATLFTGDTTHLKTRFQRDAIGPDASDDGCFSGGAFVDEDGSAYLSYWMFPPEPARGIGLAKSIGPRFEKWTKIPENPVIPSTAWGLTETVDRDGAPVIYGSADPSNIWKKDGRYYMLTGNLLVLEKFGRAPDAPLSEQGDRLYLFVSNSADSSRIAWICGRGNIFTFFTTEIPIGRNTAKTSFSRSEDNMCPSFLPLPSRPEGGPPSQTLACECSGSICYCSSATIRAASASDSERIGRITSAITATTVSFPTVMDA